MTTTVRQILQKKNIQKIITVSPEQSILEALGLMAEKDISAVLVTEGERLVGIFTERDYARKVVLKGRTSKDTKVGELMTQNLLTVSPSHTVDDVMQIMTDNRFRHLPVVEKGVLMGIVTIGDAVKTVIDQQAETIKALSGYISGEMSI
ncbi:CBS domain-containing protein [Uliginosibacterium sp. H1]|uniref:CBS domain-containing protein n=1 Tax=Uliginosibacterium sp. H1 TaxID=3114757 RepID=UPI0028088E40|nr:CBS domain-containing protein [Moraxellaceae bacterium]MEC5398608.1 CBS domain-containing protein [Uliginosibacterium sp. H1]